MRRSILRWWTCRAAAPGRWAATRRFVIACDWRICRGMPSASARFFAQLARGSAGRARRLFNLFARARGKRAGGRRCARRESSMRGRFRSRRALSTAAKRNSPRRRRGTSARLPHARRRTPLVARRSAHRWLLCCADREESLSAQPQLPILLYACSGSSLNAAKSRPSIAHSASTTRL